MGSVKIVRASAGSGKTYRLTASYIAEALASPTAFRSILAVTFTNKATSEMKERILSQLHLLATGRDDDFAGIIAGLTSYGYDDIKARSQATLEAILRDYSSFSVSTIDKFFQRIIRSFFKELGLDVSYEVIIDQKAAIAEAVSHVIEKSRLDKKVSDKIWRIVNSKLDDGKRINLQDDLTALFNKAIQSDFLAGEKIELDEVEELFSELSKLNKQTKELLTSLCREACSLIDDNGLDLNDFKYKKTSFASYFYKVVSGKIENPGARFRKIAIDQDQKDAVDLKKITKDQLLTVLPQLISLTTEVMTIYDESKEMFATVDAISENFATYTLLHHLGDELHEVNRLSGQLALSSSTTLLSEVNDGASVPFIFERLGTRYTTIYIDEFQDTSRGQWEGFLPLIEEAAAKAKEAAVMLIGDVKQAIYRWRGGDWRLLDSGIAEAVAIGEEDEIVLDTSWRSEERIVEFNNAIFNSMVSIGNGEIDRFLDESNFDSAELSGVLESGYKSLEQKISPKKLGKGKGYIEVARLEDEEKLEWLLTKISDVKERYQPSKIAVLVRGGTNGTAVAECFTRNNIEFISDELLKISKSKVVNFVINSLRYIIEGDPIRLRAMEIYLETEISDEQKELLKALRCSNVMQVIDSIVAEFGIGDRELYFLQTLYNIAYNFTKQTGGDTYKFIEEWDARLKDTSVALPPNPSAINITTIHKSKGLEYDVVIIPFADWKIKPLRGTTIWSTADKAPYSAFGCFPLEFKTALAGTSYCSNYVEEGVSSIVDNINLLYVALTRAKTELYIGLDSEAGKGNKAQDIGDLLTVAVDEFLGEKTSYGEISVGSAMNKGGDENKDDLYIDRLTSHSEPRIRIENEE